MERALKKRNLPACFFKILPATQKFCPKQVFSSALGELAKSI